MNQSCERCSSPTWSRARSQSDTGKEDCSRFRGLYSYLSRLRHSRISSATRRRNQGFGGTELESVFDRKVCEVAFAWHVMSMPEAKSMLTHSRNNNQELREHQAQCCW